MGQCPAVYSLVRSSPTKSKSKSKSKSKLRFHSRQSGHSKGRVRVSTLVIPYRAGLQDDLSRASPKQKKIPYRACVCIWNLICRGASVAWRPTLWLHLPFFYHCTFMSRPPDFTSYIFLPFLFYNIRLFRLKIKIVDISSQLL